MRFALFALFFLVATPAEADFYPATHRTGELYCTDQGTAWTLGYALTNQHTSARERERTARERGCTVLREDVRVLSAGVIAPAGGMPFVLFSARVIPAGMGDDEAMRNSDTLPLVYFILLPP